MVVLIDVEQRLHIEAHLKSANMATWNNTIKPI
jgi:hypothetical protein